MTERTGAEWTGPDSMLFLTSHVTCLFLVKAPDVECVEDGIYEFMHFAENRLHSAIVGFHIYDTGLNPYYEVSSGDAVFVSTVVMLVNMGDPQAAHVHVDGILEALLDNVSGSSVISACATDAVVAEGSYWGDVE